MANVYGENYQKSFIDEPSQPADKGTQNARGIHFYEEFTGVAAADVLYICKIQHAAKLIKSEAIVGTLGAGALQSIDKDGNIIDAALVGGSDLDGSIEGGLDIVLVADGATSASLELLLKFLMD